MWPLGDRDIFIDLGQMIGGARITYSYAIPGGVRNDMPEDFKDRAIKVFNYFEKRLVDYEHIFFENPLFLKRTQGVGVLPRNEAISLGVVGQVLRASNVKSDVRIDEPYNFYKEMDFEIPFYDTCDTWARCMVHLVEMRQSMRIIRQCLDKMPQGPVRAKLSPQQRTVVGEAYTRVEAARGAMSFHITSDGLDEALQGKNQRSIFQKSSCSTEIIDRVACCGHACNLLESRLLACGGRQVRRK